jgi:hypothetical protein
MASGGEKKMESASASASASARARASAIANAIASASADFHASAAFAAASTSTSASSARLREKTGHLKEALLEFQAAEWARRQADKKAVDAYEAHSLILSKIRKLTEWTASLRVRNLRLKLHLGRVGPGASAGLRYNLHLAAKWGTELLALESRAHADSFRLLCAMRERAGEEARLAAEVNVLQFMVEG